MQKRVSYDDLERAIERLNTTARLLQIAPFELDHGPAGQVRLVDSKRRAVLGASTGLGTASIPKRELLQRIEDMTTGMEIAYLAARSQIEQSQGAAA